MGLLTLKILNLTAPNYHLKPLTVYAELPRESTFMARLKFSFEEWDDLA